MLLFQLPSFLLHSQSVTSSATYHSNESVKDIVRRPQRHFLPKSHQNDGTLKETRRIYVKFKNASGTKLNADHSREGIAVIRSGQQSLHCFLTQKGVRRPGVNNKKNTFRKGSADRGLVGSFRRLSRRRAMSMMNRVFRSRIFPSTRVCFASADWSSGDTTERNST
jgi:hypothetical protein